MGETKKIATDGNTTFGANPFGALDGLALPQAKPAPVTPSTRKEPNKNRGRVDIRREKNGRGGKTVTVINGFTGIGLPEKETLCRTMKARCGTGGTVKDGAIEIQGDCREKVAEVLTEAGFRPVFAGG
ncbi:MAG: translation initiation factor [Verrucomicrobiota bacterium]|nr:translation initiation factor [Verrucomicrobiota bacterium]